MALSTPHKKRRNWLYRPSHSRSQRSATRHRLLLVEVRIPIALRRNPRRNAMGSSYDGALQGIGDAGSDKANPLPTFPPPKAQRGPKKNRHPAPAALSTRISKTESEDDGDQYSLPTSPVTVMQNLKIESSISGRKSAIAADKAVPFTPGKKNFRATNKPTDMRAIAASGSDNNGLSLTSRKKSHYAMGRDAPITPRRSIRTNYVSPNAKASSDADGQLSVYANANATTPETRGISLKSPRAGLKTPGRPTTRSALRTPKTYRRTPAPSRPRKSSSVAHPLSPKPFWDKKKSRETELTAKWRV